MNRNRLIRSVILLGMTLVSTFAMDAQTKGFPTEGYIGKSEIVIEDGKMSPEALLAFGRMSDPQVSPDGKHILYGRNSG